MGAAEIIEQIKRLPPEELALVKAFVSSDEFDVQYVDRAKLEETANEIFTRHDSLFRRLAQSEREHDVPSP